MDVLPAYPISRETKVLPRFSTATIRFGDGYSQNSGSTANSVGDSYQVVWEALTEADSKILTDFLDAHFGVDIFTWQPHGIPAPQKFTCGRYEGPTPVGWEDFTVVADLKREFDL